MTFGKIIDKALEELNKAGIYDARFDVYEIISEMMGVDYSSVELMSERPIGDFNVDEYQSKIERMKKGEPVAYITGTKSFYREKYKVTPGVLIPRPDTEVLVETALQSLGLCDFPMGDVALVTPIKVDGTVKIADLCTGTGCIGVSVANGIVENGQMCDGTLVDLSPEALKCASDNIKLSNAALKVVGADILNDDLSTIIEPNSLDLLLSNPPYITASDMLELDKSVKDYEPDLALYGGEDGLIFYNRLCELGKKFLKSGGALIVEHGYDQGAKVREIFEKNGFNNVTNIRDYGSNDRVVFGRT